MPTTTGKPFADTRLVVYLQRRILELRTEKTQVAIAAQAGFKSVNVLPMIKSGAIKLPLDRVPALAKALEDDPARLFLLALEQLRTDSTQEAIDQIFGAIITRNERAWLDCLRDASKRTDPALTSKSERALRAIFA